jgi:DNA polymerase-1
MIDPMHFDRVDHDDVIKKWGVPSEKLGDVLALAGDSSDNIPGAPGIGPKIAATLIEEYGSLEALMEQVDSIKQKKRKECLIENADNVSIALREMQYECLMSGGLESYSFSLCILHS